jgi:hypothetical protein
MFAEESTPLPCGPPVIHDKSLTFEGMLLVA